MFPPWHELKQSEMLALKSRAEGSLDADVIASMRALFEACRKTPDANESICYHGALALILEFDGDLDAAIEHRKIEISKIRELHNLAEMNPGDRPALKNYEEQDLQLRSQILDDVLRKAAS